MAARGFLKLLEYAERSRHATATGKDQGQTDEVWSGVSFRLMGLNFLARMGEVVEVLSIPRYTVVPGVQPWMRGVSNVRGRLLPIMDLPVFFEMESKIAESHRRILVVDMYEVFSGMVVDEVQGVQHFPVKNYAAEPVDRVPESVRPYLEGAFWKEGHYWNVFNMSRLIQEPRFVQASVA